MDAPELQQSGAPHLDFVYGQPGDIPVVGDWNGSGRTFIGVVRGNRWLLRNSASPATPATTSPSVEGPDTR